MPVRMPVASAAAAATSAHVDRESRSRGRPRPASRVRRRHRPPGDHGGVVAHTREHHALHQGLSHQPPSARAQRGSHGHPVRARSRTSYSVATFARAMSSPGPPRPAASPSTSRHRADDVVVERSHTDERVPCSTWGALPSARRQSAPSASSPVPSSRLASAGDHLRVIACCARVLEILGGAATNGTRGQDQGDGPRHRVGDVRGHHPQHLDTSPSSANDPDDGLQTESRRQMRVAEHATPWRPSTSFSAVNGRPRAARFAAPRRSRR